MLSELSAINSINKISSLADFQQCKRLEELYIRQNEIEDINQVVYLQNLQNLKNLWLGENPCAKVDGYRLSVLKALPQIQKLDNIQVTPDELKEAQKKGKLLTHPEDRPESEEEDYLVPSQPQYANNRYQEYSEHEYSPTQRVSPRQETDYEMYESGDCYTTRDENSEGSREYTPPRQASPPRQPIRSYSPDEVPVRRKNSYERESPKQHFYHKSSPPASNSFEGNSSPTDNCHKEPSRLLTSQSANCIKEYTNGNSNSYRQSDTNSDCTERRERFVCSATSHRPPFNRRPVTRVCIYIFSYICYVLACLWCFT
ncbi:hypothetical protein WA026_017643 [Henosepilachna vigintioctopunctata]|uniref:Uncharacterized protein n=1 Tax=Henosepilachna vigintioctopunctata TaxID=420089 RepID=A0AAW1V361_9CUCU